MGIPIYSYSANCFNVALFDRARIIRRLQFRSLADSLRSRKNLYYPRNDGEHTYGTSSQGGMSFIKHKLLVLRHAVGVLGQTKGNDSL